MPVRPEPLERRIAKGNPQHRPLPVGVPARVESQPIAPDWLKDHALTCWTRVSDILFMRGQLSADSELSLIALCICYAEWIELTEDLRINGRFQVTKTKAAQEAREDQDTSYLERVRPALVAFQDCDRRLKGWLIEFGLTDASRAKVAVGAPAGAGKDDPLARYGLN